MAFSLKDVRLTTRRGPSGELALYPRLLRDRSVLPKIDIAVQYFESMLGRERRDFESEVLVHFFGDHKFARCMVACLARGYRFRSRELESVVTATALRRLRRAGLDSPGRLRFALFDEVNDFGHGFLRSGDREATFGRLETRFGLRRGELERLLHLDADEQAILTRVGAEPRPEDVVAQYNFGALETLLRHAEQIDLTLSDWTTEAPDAIRRLSLANGVDAQFSWSGRVMRLLLRGRPDALGVWARHGRRVARTVVQLLERARPSVVDGSATVALRDRRAALRLTPEVLDILGGAPAPSAGWHEAAGWEQETVLTATAGSLGQRGGWAIRRLPDPQAWSRGVAVPDFALQLAGQRVFVCAVRSLAHGARLAPIAHAATTGEPVHFVGEASALAPLHAVGANTIAATKFDLRTIAEALAASRTRLDAARVAPRSA
jgi:predicted nuclease of restriction endonuclease-like RecB superfamily